MRRRRVAVVGVLVVGLALATAAVVVRRGKAPPVRGAGRQSTAAAPVLPRPGPPFAVGLRSMRFIDSTRTIRLPGRAPRARPLVTYVRYPAIGSPTDADLRDAPAAARGGPFPLIVFGHGFAVAPARYAALMRAWTQAGYVVAAPVFPLENGGAPGGPNEDDLANQPADMSLVISRMLSASAGATPFAGLIDRTRIAVAGHSDGGDTALAVAYDRRFRNRLVRAAIVLSGAEIPTVGGFAFPRRGPPLLAAQGTADVVNRPAATSAFFAAASRPKFRLLLAGAGHLPPYEGQQPQLGIVERATTAFLDYYLKADPTGLSRLTAAAAPAGVARLDAEP